LANVSSRDSSKVHTTDSLRGPDEKMDTNLTANISVEEERPKPSLMLLGKFISKGGRVS
jgi:hypothetical protein